MFFSLPENSDLEVKGDEGAVEELNGLDNSLNNISRNNDSKQSENRCDLNIDTD